MAYNVWNISLGKWHHVASFKTRDEAQDAGPVDDDFEVRKVHGVLEAHGTKLMQLKPSMIWRCAMDDLERKAHNTAVAASAKIAPHFQQEGEFKQYAFHRSHVVKAESANDILRAAIAEPGKGQASGKRDTRLLYSDVGLLKAALQ